MMLNYLGWVEPANLITSSLEKLFEDSYATSDLARFMEDGKPLSTSEFSSKVIEYL